MTIVEIRTLLKPILTDKGLLPLLSDSTLDYEINRAIKTINRCRRFVASDTVLYDSKYEDLIIPMCVSSISKMGAEGQNSHSENGVSRSYGTSGDYPKELLQEIIPLAK